jgi:hypothetical protein
MDRRVEIFCPKCTYHPRDSDRWLCLCRSLWNTFETFGTCPDCGKWWKDTQCPVCENWSPHPDWYHELISDQEEKEEVIYEKSVQVGGWQVNFRRNPLAYPRSSSRNSQTQ